jgi:hypothetical protein
LSRIHVCHSAILHGSLLGFLQSEKRAVFGTKGKDDKATCMRYGSLGLCPEFIWSMRETQCLPASKPVELSHWQPRQGPIGTDCSRFSGVSGSRVVAAQHLPTTRIYEPTLYVEICGEVVKQAEFHFG